MKCRVIFDNKNADGGFSSCGRLTFTDGGFSLAYPLDGDACTLAYDGATLTQRRTGGAPLSLAFRAGEETVCRLETGGLSGELPIFTERADVEIFPDGVKIYLFYSLGGEKTALEITATAV